MKTSILAKTGIIEISIYTFLFYKFGFLMGIVYAYLLMKIFEFLMKKLANLEPVRGCDLIFYYEQPNNQSV